MKIIDTISEMVSVSRNWERGSTVGFVPTMGALHSGHLSLVSAAKKKCDTVVVSIYVNPAQFGVGEDFTTYPRDYQRDLELLKPYGIDLVFMPTDAMMYPHGFRTWVEVGEISEILCGKSRPGHFRGVATVVLKLVNCVQPHLMFMGEKDFQQIAVLQTMLRDLNSATRIVSCPIIREVDGLAMSSRNVYLKAEERKRALCLSRSIAVAREMYQSGIHDAATVQAAIEKIISQADGVVDYIALADNETLQTKAVLDHNTRLIMAVYIGKTRLIDNSSLMA
ncbi:MAG: pantoate--beta-alanine ligase [Candidatus Cloacimonadaceae bacterium]|nr:pantoate--beta-alanine ligase [Candidatus Cloacimonadaceae bacterium]